jgi:hypothetical protein
MIVVKMRVRTKVMSLLVRVSMRIITVATIIKIVVTVVARRVSEVKNTLDRTAGKYIFLFC